MLSSRAGPDVKHLLNLSDVNENRWIAARFSKTSQYNVSCTDGHGECNSCIK